MNAREFTLGVVVLGIATALLVGCRYHHKRHYAPMPTVMFTSPAQATAINFGQAVSVAWTSSYATSCSAMTSGAMGGGFTGSQSVNGTATVVPTGPGSFTYTLTCMGAGGPVSATTPTVTVNPSILSTLSTTKIITIGSTVDPIEKGRNPYGLVLAPATAGLITAGDLVICNFNDGATNTPGLGTTIVGLHPTPGATPYRIAQSQALQGCNALTMLPDDSISALYISNVDSGSIDRISLSGDTQSTFTEIATGFCGSGPPGAVFAPSGLTYDASIDTLYIVDTSSNSVLAFSKVSSIGADGVVVNGQCTSVATPSTPPLTFSGPSASSARVIAQGNPLIAPISAALLSDGDLIVGNGDININILAGQMPNLAMEISPVLPGGFVGQPVQLDTSGTPGALFGIAATVDGQGNQIVYFNDDHTSTVLSLTK
jgi:hypothetical protein